MQKIFYGKQTLLKSSGGERAEDGDQTYRKIQIYAFFSEDSMVDLKNFRQSVPKYWSTRKKTLKRQLQRELSVDTASQQMFDLFRRHRPVKQKAQHLLATHAPKKVQGFPWSLREPAYNLRRFYN